MAFNGHCVRKEVLVQAVCPVPLSGRFPGTAQQSLLIQSQGLRSCRHTVRALTRAEIARTACQQASRCRSAAALPAPTANCTLSPVEMQLRPPQPRILQQQRILELSRWRAMKARRQSSFQRGQSPRERPAQGRSLSNLVAVCALQPQVAIALPLSQMIRHQRCQRHPRCRRLTLQESRCPR